MANPQRFEMTEAELAQLYEAAKPVPYIVAGGIEPESPAARVNRFWDALGRRMGFVGRSARPCPGEGDRVFMAEVTP